MGNTFKANRRSGYRGGDDRARRDEQYRGRGPTAYAGGNGPGAPPFRQEDEIVSTKTVTCERKKIVLSRRKNRGGEFLRIDEYRNGHDRPNIVIVPLEDVDAFLAELDEMFPEQAEPASTVEDKGTQTA